MASFGPWKVPRRRRAALLLWTRRNGARGLDPRLGQGLQRRSLRGRGPGVGEGCVHPLTHNWEPRRIRQLKRRRSASTVAFSRLVRARALRLPAAGHPIPSTDGQRSGRRPTSVLRACPVAFGLANTLARARARRRSGEGRDARSGRRVCASPSSNTLVNIVGSHSRFSESSERGLNYVLKLAYGIYKRWHFQ